MHRRIISLICISILIGCIDTTKEAKSGNRNIDTLVYESLYLEDSEDTIFLDTVKYHQVTINDLPLQIDTGTAVELFLNPDPSSRGNYGHGHCYAFGDAPIWDFNGNRYYIDKDSLYFHELYFDDSYKKQNFVIKLPNIIISAATKIVDFEKAYPMSFANSKRKHEDEIILRTGDPQQCQFRIDFKEGKIWRFAFHD